MGSRERCFGFDLSRSVDSPYSESMIAYKSFEEFWPFYLAQHANRICRFLHAFGTILGIGLVIATFVLGRPGLLGLAPIAGYGFSWIGHFFFEKNRPATFRYPKWSLIGDFRMLKMILTGQIQSELNRLGIRS
jgi:hypothetical protein